MSSGLFRARFLLKQNELAQVEVWDDELTLFDFGHRPVREWVHSHFCECYSEKDLREWFELPAEGSYEVLVEGKIDVYFVGWEYQEYEEDVGFSSIKVQKIPEEYMEKLREYAEQARLEQEQREREEQREADGT